MLNDHASSSISANQVQQVLTATRAGMRAGMRLLTHTCSCSATVQHAPTTASSDDEDDHTRMVAVMSETVGPGCMTSAHAW